MASEPSEKRTKVSRYEDENHPHVLVHDTILKDMQMKLEKLNVLDKINEGLIRIDSNINSVRGSISDLGRGLNFVNTEVAEVKVRME